METNWRFVADMARVTIGQEAGTGEPSDKWKKRILLAEHSPIRLLHFQWKWKDLPYWISNHFIRHKFGIEHFVSTSRTDRTGVDRTKLPQDNPVDHACEANAQALINISRKRLCMKASPETREAWKEVVAQVTAVDPVVGSVLVSDCVYKGFCPEFKSCGYVNSSEYEERLKQYRG